MNNLKLQDTKKDLIEIKDFLLDILKEKNINLYQEYINSKNKI